MGNLKKIICFSRTIVGAEIYFAPRLHERFVGKKILRPSFSNGGDMGLRKIFQPRSLKIPFSDSLRISPVARHRCPLQRPEI